MSLCSTSSQTSSSFDDLGFVVYPPDGAYFILADHTGFGRGNDEEFCQYLVEKVGVAAIPPSYFYDDPQLGRALVRFAFCKTEEVLREALARMSVLKAHG